MEPQAKAWLIFFGIGFIFAGVGLAAHLQAEQLREQINKRLSKDQQFEYLGWGPARYLRFFHELRQQPDSTPLRRLRLFIGVMR